MENHTPTTKRQSKIAKTVAQDILSKADELYKNAKAGEICVMYCKLRDYIQQTYLSEEK